MEVKTKNISVFVARDGKEFLDKKECEDYERQVLDRDKNFSYFIIYHSPDLTEGRGYQSSTRVIVEGGTDVNPISFVIYYCLKYFGDPIVDFYGNPRSNWMISECQGEPEELRNNIIITSNNTPYKNYYIVNYKKLFNKR